MENNDLISRSDVLELMEVDFRYEQCNQVSDYVENIPAVDAAPVVHGRWDFSGVFGGNLIYQCNLCGRIIVLHEHGDLKKEFPCCHCGARMDGKEPTHE